MHEESSGYDTGGMRLGMPKPTRAVKYLLVANFAVFLVQELFIIRHVNLAEYFGATAEGWWQVWRYLTFQFLHEPYNLLHIVLNMLGLYMLGTPLETLWGPKRFLQFYLSCGAFAGVVYVIVASGRAPGRPPGRGPPPQRTPWLVAKKDGPGRTRAGGNRQNPCKDPRRGHQ